MFTLAWMFLQSINAKDSFIVNLSLFNWHVNFVFIYNVLSISSASLKSLADGLIVHVISLETRPIS